MFKSKKYYFNLRNQDSGKVFFLEKQEYVDRCKTHDTRLPLTILVNLPAPQHQATDTAQD